MAINKLRHLQLIRNAQITNQRAAAKAAAEAEKASLQTQQLLLGIKLVQVALVTLCSMTHKK